MSDIVVFGHTTVDLFFKGESFTRKDDRFFLAIGGKYFADSFAEKVGGGGANVSIGIARHGLKPFLVSDISSSPFDKIIEEKLLKEGVDISFCRKGENEFNISCILLSGSGEKTVISYETPNRRFVEKERLERVLDISENFYFANLQEVPLQERIGILKKIKNKGGRIFSNLGVKDCRGDKKHLYEYLSYVDFIIQNTWEFADIVGVEKEKINFKKNLQEIFVKFAGKVLIITDGKNGSYGYVNGNVYYQPAVEVVKIVDTTGAGDAFTAGFISGILKGKDIKKAMEMGAVYSAKILQKLGAN